MLALAGYPLGLRFRVYDSVADAPASHTAEQRVGDFDDEPNLLNFAAGIDVVTYEFENVPVQAANLLSQRVPVYPPPRALQVSQDRLTEKSFFNQLGIPTPRFAKLDDITELDAALERTGVPAVLKTRRMGYDGKGQQILSTREEAARAFGHGSGSAFILEQYIPFQRELSILAVRGMHSDQVFYPPVVNVHRAGILCQSVPMRPAPEDEHNAHIWQQAQDYAARVLRALDYVGVLALEFFEVDGHLLANEMAPRVHNSGHWTIEGAETSQFENHIRAIAGLPLGSTVMRGYCAMVNLIGCVPNSEEVLAVPGAHLHLYSKAPRPGRKLGHITIRADTQEECANALARLHALVDGS
jgi:5-(carboxyamino)imidazole ribonucleotide synthase